MRFHWGAISRAVGAEHWSGALLFATALHCSGCMRETSPGHYVLGFGGSGTPAQNPRRATPAAVTPVAAAGVTPHSLATAPAQVTAPTREAQDPSWTRELPTVADVRSKIGSDVARQAAAFEVLKNYIDARVGRSVQFEGSFGSADAPPLAVKRWAEYNTAQTWLSPEAARYAAESTFDLETLTRVVSPEAAQAYRASPGLQQKLSQETHAPAVRVFEKSIAWIKSDLLKADAAHSDLSLLGLQLGQSLELAKCQDTKGSDASCLLDGPHWMAGLSSMIGAGGTPREPELDGAQDVDVVIAGAKCPAWAFCYIGATVLGGAMVRATIGVHNDFASDKVAELLERKYGSPDTSREASCTYTTYATGFANGATVSVPTGTQTVSGNALSWSKAGLLVFYDPHVGGYCGGRVVVELPGVRSEVAAAAARAEAQQPKL